MTNINMINELNNNSIFPAANGKKKQLPDSIINSKTDIGRISGLYKNDDGYRPYTIYSGEFCPYLHRNYFWFLDPFYSCLVFLYYNITWKLAWSKLFNCCVSCWRQTVSKLKGAESDDRDGRQ